ncbi:MAG: ATP-binding protein, partial [Streptosporangiaceae bacterium]
ADVERLFQPFQRLGRRRANYKDGHGLGLSIVRAIAIAHHASITACPGPEGGLIVSVTFPPSASPAAGGEHHSGHSGHPASLASGFAGHRRHRAVA